MPKFKIVATGPIKFALSLSTRRLWIEPANTNVDIRSIADVPWDQIPLMTGFNSGLGRFALMRSVAVRSDLTEQDFEVEIVDA